MTEKELKAYFGTLKLAKETIGYNRENRKHLFRLEKLGELILSNYESGVLTEFKMEGSFKEFERLLEADDEIRNVYIRDDNYHHCHVPGRPVVEFDDRKAYRLAQNHKKAPNVETLQGRHVKSVRETGQENLSLVL